MLARYMKTGISNGSRSWTKRSFNNTPDYGFLNWFAIDPCTIYYTAFLRILNNFSIYPSITLSVLHIRFRVQSGGMCGISRVLVLLAYWFVLATYFCCFDLQRQNNWKKVYLVCNLLSAFSNNVVHDIVSLHKGDYLHCQVLTELG